MAEIVGKPGKKPDRHDEIEKQCLSRIVHRFFWSNSQAVQAGHRIRNSFPAGLVPRVKASPRSLRGAPRYSMPRLRSGNITPATLVAGRCGPFLDVRGREGDWLDE